MCDTASPFGRPFHLKVDQVICQRTTVPFFIDHFHLKQYHIRTIRFPSFRTLNQAQPDLFRLTCRLQLSAAAFFSVFVISHSFQLARHKSDISESIQEMVAPFAIPQRFPIQEQLYLIGTRYDIYRFHYRIIIVPMADNINTGTFRIYPAVPHHLMCKERIFRNTHGVSYSATTIIFYSAIVRIGIGEDNLHATRTYTITRSRTFTPVIEPANDIFDGKGILITVVDTGIHFLLYFVGNGGLIRIAAVSILVIRIGIIIPVFAQSLVTAILHCPHRMMRTLIDIQHFASIFRFADVQHFTGTDCTAAVRIVQITYRFHLKCVHD